MTYYTPNMSRPAHAASVLALEMLEDPIFILDPDDNVYYSNRAARDLFLIPENNERTFEKIVTDSDIISGATLIDQLNLGGKTQGRYLLRRGIFSQTIRVYSQEFKLQRVVRIAFQKWEPSFRHEQLINKIVNMDTEKIGLEKTCSNLISLFFELLNIDVAIVSLCERDQATGKKYLKPIEARGVMLEKDFRWEVIPLGVQHAFEKGQCTRSDGSEWAETGVSEFVIIPLTGFSERVGVIHLGVVDTIDLFQSKRKNEPANAIDVLDEDFFARLQIATSQLVERVSGDPLQRKSLIASIFSELNEGMLFLDRTGKVIYATPEAYRIAESSWESMNDKRTYRVCDKDGVPLPRAKWPLFRALMDGEEFENEPLVLDFGTHQKPIRFSVRVKPDFFIVTMEDVSDELARARNQEDFYSSIAHELRTPITPLKGLLQILSKEMESDTSNFDLLSRAQRQVDRLAKLIDDMLEATRIDSGIFQIRRELVDVSKLVCYQVENWRLQFPKASIEVNESDSMICVLDPYRFEQVLCNLIENSIKYCEHDPLIEIRLRDSPFVLEIADNGIGMTEDVISKIFNRFYQANTGVPNHGVGIGLYVTKKIIDLHDGTISFESEVGKGTIVRVEGMCSKET